MARGIKQHIYGGLYIPTATGATDLWDLIGLADTTQDLVDQVITDTATLYITLNHAVKDFALTSVTVGYVDTANANDWANLYLLEGAAAADSVQAIKTRYISGAISEGPLTQSTVGLHRPMHLDTAGRVWFITDWTTAVISCGAATEYLYIRIDGEEMATV